MLNRNFLRFIELLEKNNVRHLVVGGYAVGLYGFPRYTGDIDIFIAISKENARSVLKTFSDFGFGDLGLQTEDFLEEEIVVEIGREPLKIQVLTGIDGVTFEECWAFRVRSDDADAVYQLQIIGDGEEVYKSERMQEAGEIFYERGERNTDLR